MTMTAEVKELAGQLAELVKQVQAGNEVLLTQGNKPVAKLVPAGAPEQKDLKKIAEEIRELRKGSFLRGLSIRELIAQGRRF